MSHHSVHTTHTDSTDASHRRDRRRPSSPQHPQAPLPPPLATPRHDAGETSVTPAARLQEGVNAAFAALQALAQMAAAQGLDVPPLGGDQAPPLRPDVRRSLHDEFHAEDHLVPPQGASRRGERQPHPPAPTESEIWRERNATARRFPDDLAPRGRGRHSSGRPLHGRHLYDPPPHGRHPRGRHSHGHHGSRGDIRDRRSFSIFEDARQWLNERRSCHSSSRAHAPTGSQVGESNPDYSRHRSRSPTSRLHEDSRRPHRSASTATSRPRGGPSDQAIATPHPAGQQNASRHAHSGHGGVPRAAAALPRSGGPQQGPLGGDPTPAGGHTLGDGQSPASNPAHSGGAK